MNVNVNQVNNNKEVNNMLIKASIRKEAAEAEAEANGTSTGTGTTNASRKATVFGVLKTSLAGVLRVTLFLGEFTVEGVFGGACALMHPIGLLQGNVIANLVFFLAGYHFFGYLSEWESTMAWLTVLYLAVLVIYKFFN